MKNNAVKCTAIVVAGGVAITSMILDPSTSGIVVLGLIAILAFAFTM